VLGKATSYTYGVTNRFYAKRRSATLSQAQEIIDVRLSQSYYSDANSALYDHQYSTNAATACTVSVANACSPPSHFSPVLLDVRVTPSRAFDATVHTEYDGTYHAFRTLSAGGTYNWTNLARTSVTWNENFLIPQLQSFSWQASLTT